MKEYMELPFEIKAEDVSDDGFFKGYGSTFGGEPDSYGDIIHPGAFSKSLEKGGRNGFGIAMLWQHDPHQPIGTWLNISEDAKGLLVEGKLTKGVQKADEALLLMKDSALRGLSIGYDISKGGSEYDKEKQVRNIKSVNLWEISPVTFPANIYATITNVKAIEQSNNERELETALREAGLSKKASMIVVRMCKPYLREIRIGKGIGDIYSVLRSANTEYKIIEAIKNIGGL